MESWPKYVCAILRDRTGRLLLELRPPTATLAPGRLTCFGGRREPGEDPEVAVKRELLEELGWQPAGLEKRVVLSVSGAILAWFYEGELDVGLEQLRLLPGTQALLAAPDELAALPISRWHAKVLDAWGRGETTVELEA